ncbi:hypothetical protein STANM309S_06734 [Streptomyces tanashiensis]
MARKPMPGTRAPMPSQSSRARRAVSSSSPPARPLTQIWPKLREGSSARLGLALDVYDLVAAFHCVPGVHGSATPAPTTITFMTSTVAGVGGPDGSGGRRDGERTDKLGPDPLPFRDHTGRAARAPGTQPRCPRCVVKLNRSPR